MKKLILLIVIMCAVAPAFSQATRGVIVLRDTGSYKPTNKSMLMLDSGNNIQFWDKDGMVFSQVARTIYGAVTQLTSATTTVQKSATRGVITTVALTTAAGASFEFTFTNSFITDTKVIQLTGMTAGTGSVLPALVSQGNGTCVIRVTNTGSGAFNAPAKIHFVIL